jgi:hypothetical protein
LISNVTDDHWLDSNGVLAFLMPDTLLNSDSYEGWRKLKAADGSTMYLSKIVDWSSADHPFKPVTDSFLTYLITKRKAQDLKLIKIKKNFPKGIDIKYINSINNWNDARHYFTSCNGNLVQLSKTSNRYSRLYGATQDEITKFKLLYGKNNYKARQGVELTPREVYVFEKDAKGTYSNISKKNTKIKPIHKKHLRLEEKIMRPLVQSFNVGNFVINRDKIEYGLIPYDFNQKIYSQKDMQKFEKAYAYLLEQRDFIEQQSARSKAMAIGKEFYALSKLGEYSTFDYAVVFRDNSSMKASFIDNTGDMKLFPVKHAPYISRDIDNKPITKDEALYITGILNTPIINRYFKVTYSGRSYSINFDINIPKYKGTVLQNSIVSNVEKIIYNNADYASLVEEIQEDYLNLLKKGSY